MRSAIKFSLVVLLAGLNLVGGASAQTTPQKAETVYVAICRDKPDGTVLRYGPKGVIKAHLDYIDSIKDRVAIGGPSYSSAEKNGVHGSVIVYHASDLTEAKNLLENDPLYPVFESYSWDSFATYVSTYVAGWAAP